MKPTRAGLGWAELLLCAAVLTAAWTRTPIGALARNAVALARGTPTEDVLAAFRIEISADLDQSLALALANPPTVQAGPTIGGWTPALQTAVRAHLGPELLATAQGIEAPPEEALEIALLGQEAVNRAIARARASGERHPRRLEAHRRFLPDEEARQADSGLGEALALATVLDLAWPVDGDPRISSGYGMRVHPVTGIKKLHQGVDLAIPIGTPVYAAAEGVVLRTREDDVSGRYLVLDHGHGVTTVYCHADSIEVSKGDRVERRAPIMDSGNSGHTTGPHLHFGLRIGGRSVDPMVYRPAPSTVAING